MSYIYYPGCKYTVLSPTTSKKIKDYIQTKDNTKVAGCCRVDHRLLKEGDTALVVCPTCLFNLKKNAPKAGVQSLWEVLAEDMSFPWPNYKGKAISVQDCKDTVDNKKLQNSVREILKKMNVTIVEIDKSFEKADNFCNISPTHTENQIKRHCETFVTDTVVSYCTGCHNALKIGGKKAVHLLDLIWNNC